MQMALTGQCREDPRTSFEFRKKKKIKKKANRNRICNCLVSARVTTHGVDSRNAYYIIIIIIIRKTVYMINSVCRC